MTVDQNDNAAAAGREDGPQGSCSKPAHRRPGEDSAIFEDRACRARNGDSRPSKIDVAAGELGGDSNEQRPDRADSDAAADSAAMSSMAYRGESPASSAAAAEPAMALRRSARKRNPNRKRNAGRADLDDAEEAFCRQLGGGRKKKANRKGKGSKKKDEEEEAKKAAKAVVEEELEKGEEGTQSCCICLDTPEYYELSGVDGCDHRYCFGCIERWAETAENACPQCKRRFTRIGRVRRRSKKDDGGDGNNEGRHEKNGKRVKRRDQRSDDFGDGNPLREGSFGEWVDPQPLVVRSAPLPLLPDAFPDFRRGDSASRALFDSDDDEEYRRFVRRPSRNSSPLEAYAIGGSGGVVSSPSAGTSSVVGAGSFGGPGSTAETALEIDDDDSDDEVIEVIEVG